MEGQASGENRKVEARFLSEPKSWGKVFKWTEKWGQASGEDWKVGAAFKTDKENNAFVALNHCNFLLPRSNFSCFFLESNLKLVCLIWKLRQVGGFSPCIPISSTYNTDCHDITEILLKMTFKFSHCELFIYM